MKIRRLIAGILLMSIMSSCAFHSGVFTNSTCLSTNNFKIMRLAKGEAKTTKIFGIGGLDKNALVFEAKKDLYANYPLKENQTLANVTVDFKNSIMLFVMETKVTMTADIVEFGDRTTSNNNAVKSNPVKQIENVTDNTWDFTGHYLYTSNITTESNSEHSVSSNEITYTKNRKGKTDSASVFNGKNSYISFSNFNPNNIKTINFWVKPKSLSYVNTTVFFVLKNAGKDDGVACYSEKNKFVFDIISNDTRITVKSKIDIAQNKYSMITCVINEKGMLNIYVNGEFSGKSFISMSTITQNPPLVPKTALIFGANKDLDNCFFEGTIEDVKLFSRALDKLEISELFSK